MTYYVLRPLAQRDFEDIQADLDRLAHPALEVVGH